MNTTHGYHIIGTEFVKLPDGFSRIRCGGPRFCKMCGSEALKVTYPRQDELTLTNGWALRPDTDERDTPPPTYLMN